MTLPKMKEINLHFCYRSSTPQTRSPGGSSTGAERDSSGAITKDRTVSYYVSCVIIYRCLILGSKLLLNFVCGLDI